jgi:hypothetical protein
MAHTLPRVCFGSLIKIKLEALGKHNNASALEINQDDDLNSHFPPKTRHPAAPAAGQ